MKKKQGDLFFNKTLKIFLFVILPLLFIYVILNTNITGFSINDPDTEIGIASGIFGAFLGTVVLFFIALLILLKIRHKAFKPADSKK